MLLGVALAQQSRQGEAIPFFAQAVRLAALARAYGGLGEVVEKTAEFGPALQRALEHANGKKLPAVIELRYDGNLITPNATLETIRKNAQAAKGK